MSNDLANYITMAFDPAVSNLVLYQRQFNPDFVEGLIDLEEELDEVLEENGMDILELMEAMAVR